MLVFAVVPCWTCCLLLVVLFTRVLMCALVGFGIRCALGIRRRAAAAADDDDASEVDSGRDD